jgi:hypothetical protein
LIGTLGQSGYQVGTGTFLNWLGHNGPAPIDAARSSNAAELVESLRTQGAKSARERNRAVVFFG